MLSVCSRDQSYGFKRTAHFPQAVRSTLPYLLTPGSSVPIWKILKNFIRKDLTQVSLPVILNEPLSTLQKSAEIIGQLALLKEITRPCSEYSPKESCRRLLFATLVNVAHYSSTCRTKKPFNPILGETYESVGEDYRFVAEQVSHYPPISAFCLETEGLKMQSHAQIT